MLDITNDIQSLTSFRRRPAAFMRRLRKTKRPVVLTVRGKAAAVVQDAQAYQRLLDLASEVSFEEGVRQGLKEANAGKGRPLKEFLAEFEARHGLHG